MTREEYRALLKKHHLCRECKCQDAYTYAGRTLCAACAEKDRARKERLRESREYRGKEVRWHKDMAARREAAGLCVRCGKNPPLEGLTVCDACRRRGRKYSEKARRKRGVQPRGNGMCWQCNKRPCEDGKGLCKSCYEKMVPIAIENAEKGWGKPHQWR